MLSYWKHIQNLAESFEIMATAYGTNFVKVGFSPFKTNCFSFIESPLKMMKNACYSTLEVLFILKILKCLTWLSGHVEKMAWLER